MTRKSSKFIKLRAFRIKNSLITKSNCNLLEQLKNKLHFCQTALDRTMIANHNDINGERDLIAYYEFVENPRAIFCLVMTIAQEGNHEAFSENLLKQNQIKLEDITKDIEQKDSISCLNSYYFLLYKDIIITTLPTNQTIKKLQIYLNWFTNAFVELLPIINTDALKLSDIKSIIIQDNSIKQNYQPSLPVNEKKSKTISLKENILSGLKYIIQDTDSLQQIDLSEVISASLSIEFNRPKTMSEGDYQDILSAIIKPIADIEDCTFRYQNDKITRKGNEIIKIQRVEVQKTSNGNINEKDLMQTMNNFAVSITPNENIN